MCDLSLDLFLVETRESGAKKSSVKVTPFGAE